MAGFAAAAALEQLQTQLEDYTNSLLNEGFLDDHFSQLQALQDEDNPNFVSEVLKIFFDDSERLLGELAKSLTEQNDEKDFKRINAHVHQLKGSSSSVGALKVQKACLPFRTSCEEKNIEGCLKCLQQVRHEYSETKPKLETFLVMEQQVMRAAAEMENNI